MGLLRCTKCKCEKPATLEFFTPNKAKRNKLDSWCRECRRGYRSSISRGKFRNSISDEDLIYLKSTTSECVICGCSSRLGVDHDHVSGKVRGILCSNCNAGLGFFKDDPDLLEYARIYILSSIDHPEADEYLNSGSRTCSTESVERVEK